MLDCRGCFSSSCKRLFDLTWNVLRVCESGTFRRLEALSRFWVMTSEEYMLLGVALRFLSHCRTKQAAQQYIRR